MSMTPIEVRERVSAIQADRDLAGDDEDTTQFRNVVKAAKLVVDQLGERRSKMSETDQYTPKGLAIAIGNEAKIAALALSNLQTNNLAPRVERLTTELANLAPPTVGDEIDPLERNRLVETYRNAASSDREQMRARALTNRKLATALSEEDPSVTGLTEPFINQLRETITEDPHQAKRADLKRKLNAAKAAERAIEGATASVRRATEEE